MFWNNFHFAIRRRPVAIIIYLWLLYLQNPEFLMSKRHCFGARILWTHSHLSHPIRCSPESHRIQDLEELVRSYASTLAHSSSLSLVSFNWQFISSDGTHGRRRFETLLNVTAIRVKKLHRSDNKGYCITTPRTILENLLTLLALRILDNTGEHELNFRPVQTPLWKRRSRRRVKKLLRMFTMILH